MPSTYAHYAFGRQVLASLPENTAKRIEKDRSLYDIGLHGPDLLFYYKPLGKNKINAIGFGMHARPASKFFLPAAEMLKKDARGTAYVLGFICHFALDFVCHSYIENKIRLSGVTHTEIESEFDRSLLLAEGKDPLSARLTGHICPSRENAERIAPFFGIPVKAVKKALRSMIFYNGLLRAPHQPKRFFVNTALRLSGNYKEMHGMMIAKNPIAACEDSDLRLKKLFGKAVPLAVSLIGSFLGYVHGENDFPEEFSETFSHRRGWKEIPVLSAEEERAYTV